MVPGDVGTERIVVMVVVGLAAGLALAALLTGLRLRIAERSETRLGRLEPSVDA
jgi:hypothetical protein